MKITLTTAQAVSLAKSISPAISTEPMKYHLHSVQVHTADGTTTFTATDGYRLHRITVPQTSGESCEPFQVGGVELVGALLGTAKAIGKGIDSVELVTEIGDKMVATGAGVTMNIPIVNVDFPACASILDVNLETESGASYDTVYLADMITAAGHISGKKKVAAKYISDAGMVKIENIHPRKPMHVTASSTVTGMQFKGVLMPRRAS